MTRTGWQPVGRCAPRFLVGLWGLLLLSACAQGATHTAGERDGGAANGAKGGNTASATGGAGGAGGASPSGTGSFGNAPTPPQPMMPGDAGAMMSSGDSGADASQSVDASGPPGDVGTCTDKKKNGHETDVDCGGKDCPKCGAKDSCVADDDCDTNVCDATDVCCAPRKVADCTATQCGMIQDGCGGVVTCPNNCPGGACSGGTCCMPRTVTSCANTECGAVANGCGGTLSCPNNCNADETCQSGRCVAMCEVASCPSCGIGDILYQKCCRSDERCGCQWTPFAGCALP